MIVIGTGRSHVDSSPSMPSPVVPLHLASAPRARDAPDVRPDALPALGDELALDVLTRAGARREDRDQAPAADAGPEPARAVVVVEQG